MQFVVVRNPTPRMAADSRTGFCHTLATPEEVAALTGKSPVLMIKEILETGWSGGESDGTRFVALDRNPPNTAMPSAARAYLKG